MQRTSQLRVSHLSFMWFSFKLRHTSSAGRSIYSILSCLALFIEDAQKKINCNLLWIIILSQSYFTLVRHLLVYCENEYNNRAVFSSVYHRAAALACVFFLAKCFSCSIWPHSTRGLLKTGLGQGGVHSGLLTNISQGHIVIHTGRHTHS